MKTRGSFSLALSLAMVMVLAAFAAGCGTYKVQGSFNVGPPVDQMAPTTVTDVNGKERVKPPEQPRVDLVGLGDVRFGQRSYQGAGTLTTPAKQVVIQEKRTVKTDTYADERNCPLKEQITKVKTEETEKTETFTRVENHPSETVGLNTTLNADDGPGTKLTSKGMDVVGNFASKGLYGLLRKPDRIDFNGGNATNAPGPTTNTVIGGPNTATATGTGTGGDSTNTNTLGPVTSTSTTN